MQVLLLDLDETLYPRGNGVLARVDARINAYLHERIGVPAHEVDVVRRRLRDAHGTTLRGLEARYEVDVEDYLATVHGVDLSDLLSPAPGLRALLRRLPGRKAVFTNAPRQHAEQVLGLLDLSDAFEEVVAIEDLSLRPKPDPLAYHAVTARLGVEARACVMVDDTRANVVAGARAGMRTVWLAPTPQDDESVHHVITSLHELERVLAPRGSGHSGA
ncbi:MAG: pyrimidine 5'-nucleotidase [Deltaproteobacteria bacterium]|nr:pyrimidine 5'-nucleotidase [Deltaproteobacteria bacterium]